MENNIRTIDTEEYVLVSTDYDNKDYTYDNQNRNLNIKVGYIKDAYQIELAPITKVYKRLSNEEVKQLYISLPYKKIKKYWKPKKNNY